SNTPPVSAPPTPLRRRPCCVLDHLRSLRIVQTQHGRLRKGVGGAETGGVFEIAFDLRGPAHLTLDEHACPVARERHRRSEVESPSRNNLFGLLHIRNNFFGCCRRTSAETRQ